jgi:hypothetical protein
MENTLKMPEAEKPSLMREMIVKREEYVEWLMEKHGFGECGSPEEAQAQAQIRDFIRLGFEGGWQWTLEVLQAKNAALKKGKIILPGA